MTPLDVAEKWARAGYDLWAHHTEAPNVHTLHQRVVAHYGRTKPHSLTEIMAVATVEAMNEWQHYNTTNSD